jgi:hypothetical protein
LLDVGFIKEVYHLDWFANLILIPKKNKDWRMCVDYTIYTRHVKKICSAGLKSTKSWTPRTVVTF